MCIARERALQAIGSYHQARGSRPSRDKDERPLHDNHISWTAPIYLLCRATWCLIRQPYLLTGKVPQTYIMAFNFNWSPLTADASFYERAQEMLTTALNKSPKPPIIVDDILVSQLDLGHTAPDLEILEIGDLAEDRFRGIFKLCYSGDAFLTLQTRVQVRRTQTFHCFDVLAGEIIFCKDGAQKVYQKANNFDRQTP